MGPGLTKIKAKWKAGPIACVVLLCLSQPVFGFEVNETTDLSPIDSLISVSDQFDQMSETAESPANESVKELSEVERQRRYPDFETSSPGFAANQMTMPPVFDNENLRTVADTFKKLTGDEISLPSFESRASDSNASDAKPEITNGNSAFGRNRSDFDSRSAKIESTPKTEAPPQNSPNEGKPNEPGKLTLWEQLEALQNRAEPDLKYSVYEEIREFLSDHERELSSLTPFDRDFIKKLGAAALQFKELDTRDDLKKAQSKSIEKFIELNSKSVGKNGADRNRSAPTSLTSPSH